MSLFGKFFSGGDAKVAQPEVQAVEAQVQSDEELIAVITAAIAAFDSNKTISNLVVRKVSREQGRVTVWSNAGREACMQSRRV